MKRSLLIRLLCLLCVCTLLLLCACNEQTDETSSNASSQAPADESSEAQETFIAPAVVDLGGREINIFCWDWTSGSKSILGFSGEVLFDEENPDNVDQAKEKVIDRVETDYNCKIGGKLENSPTWVNTVENMVLSGLFEYDILFSSAGYGAHMMGKDLLTDLTTVSTIHLENPWWDQNAVHDFSLANHLYYVCGDINTYDNLGTWCVLFNKSMKSRLGIDEDFYQLAKSGKWTFDKLVEICQGVTMDLNGDGIDEHDQWAFGTETYNVFVQLVGGGVHVVAKDEATDLPYFVVDVSKSETYGILDKVVNFYNSKEVMVANGGKYDGKYANVWEETVHKSFIEGRELFYMCGLIHAASFRAMKDEFGILPIPKMSESQDSYHHTTSSSNSSVMSIPFGIDGKDLEDLGTVIEALAMYSREWVTPEFYDVQLKTKDSRDNDSEEMLDLIFSTRSFDLGPIYNWGGILECYTTLNTDFESRFSSKLDAAKLAMNETLELIELNN